jgi:anti-sigma regulatory factor (Ser/Thr protein kinase)
MDEFVVTIPREPNFSVVADLVVGGIAARHEFTLDVLEDLQLALDALLAHGEDDGGEITVELRVGEGDVSVHVGPVGDETVAELEREAGTSLGLRRLLETTVDDVSLATRDSGEWVELRKTYALAGAEG